MSTQPETALIRAVRLHLRQDRPDIYATKLTVLFHDGMPDCLYDGPGGNLWVEYKWLPNVPSRAKASGLTKLQDQWLERSWRNGTRTWLAVGAPKVLAVRRKAPYREPFKRSDFESCPSPAKRMAFLISQAMQKEEPEQ